MRWDTGYLFSSRKLLQFHSNYSLESFLISCICKYDRREHWPMRLALFDLYVRFAPMLQVRDTGMTERLQPVVEEFVLGILSQNSRVTHPEK